MSRKLIISIIVLILVIGILVYARDVNCHECPESSKPYCQEGEEIVEGEKSKYHWYCLEECSASICAPIG